MLARSSPSKRPRKPCKRDHTPRALRIVSPQCAQRSEPSKADSLHASDTTLSSLPTVGEVQHTYQQVQESILDRSDPALKRQLPHTQQPTSNSRSEFETYTYHDDTTSVPQHTSSFSRCIARAFNPTTLAFSIECGEYRFGRIPCWDERAGCCRNNDHLFSLRTRRSYYYTIERRFPHPHHLHPPHPTPKLRLFLSIFFLPTANTNVSFFDPLLPFFFSLLAVRMHGSFTLLYFLASIIISISPPRVHLSAVCFVCF